MKLLSFRSGDRSSFGILRPGDDVLDVPEVFSAFGRVIPGSGTLRSFLAEANDPMESLIGLVRKMEGLPAEALDELRSHGILRPLSSLVHLAPIPDPTKIIAVGMNYHDHCREQHVEPPKSPVLFAKFPSAVTAHDAEIVWDGGTTSKVDFEAELGVVVGRRTSRISAGDALSSVLGYTAVNDVSARDLQFGDGQWVRGKSLDTFCPMGPVITTSDEIPDPQHLQLRCSVNGTIYQDSNTSEMIFNVAQVIEFISRVITLEPGDVIATGTPAGVGVFRKPPVFLRNGDIVTVEIDRIGELRNRCRILAA